MVRVGLEGADFLAYFKCVAQKWALTPVFAAMATLNKLKLLYGGNCTGWLHAGPTVFVIAILLLSVPILAVAQDQGQQTVLERILYAGGVGLFMGGILAVIQWGLGGFRRAEKQEKKEVAKGRVSRISGTCQACDMKYGRGYAYVRDGRCPHCFEPVASAD